MAGDVPAHPVWEDDDHLAFLDINPINPGHTLLVPKQHVGYVFDMDDVAYSNLFERAKMLAKNMREALGTKRIGIMIEGFKVPHVHVHLVPINDHTELNPYNAKPADADELEAAASKIRVYTDIHS